MSKKSLIEREKKRYWLVQKYLKKRLAIKDLLKRTKFTSTSTLDDKIKLHLKLQNLPRNSAPTRLHNRCSVTGRPKSFIRSFQVSRNVLREYALKGLLPGVRKSSW
uniref:ribosomal protein S14 n=1 Tax=Prototheca miyajii TaxID=2034260 RepID=UPI003001DB29